MKFAKRLPGIAAKRYQQGDGKDYNNKKGQTKMV